MVIRFKTSVETRNGEDYLKIKKVLVDIQVKGYIFTPTPTNHIRFVYNFNHTHTLFFCSNMHTQFENLFNDAALSKNINAVLNDNALLLFNEVRHTFGVERGKIIRNHISPLFEKIPYRMLFADEE